MRLIGVCIVLAAGCGASAQPASRFGADWVRLFNGSDLTGWKIVGPSGGS
jgi:hypothetical protein